MASMASKQTVSYCCVPEALWHIQNMCINSKMTDATQEELSCMHQHLYVRSEFCLKAVVCFFIMSFLLSLHISPHLSLSLSFPLSLSFSLHSSLPPPSLPLLLSLPPSYLHPLHYNKHTTTQVIKDRGLRFRKGNKHVGLICSQLGESSGDT